jgi:2-phosphosulfolactate phosphatase
MPPKIDTLLQLPRAQTSVKLSVYHTPELLPAQSVPDCAVVIDVLRATSTIVAVLNAGAEAVQVFSNIELLLQTSEQFPPEQRLRAGERGGKQVEGCEKGNSPLEYTPEDVKGRRLFMSTTNGTRCLESVQIAGTVLGAALTNRQAVVQYLIAQQPSTVWLVGSGWEGDYALEDTVCAGAIADGILTQTDQNLKELAGNDELVGAVSLYRQWQSELLELLSLSSHGQRLLGLQRTEDLAYCAKLDTFATLPIQREPGVLVRQ